MVGYGHKKHFGTLFEDTLFITVLRLALLIIVDPQEVSVSVVRMTREDDAEGADVLMVLGNTRSSLLQDTYSQDTDNCPLLTGRLKRLTLRGCYPC